MTGALICLSLVCFSQAATIILLGKVYADERARLVNHLLADTPDQYAQLQRAEAPRPRRKPDPDRPTKPQFPEGM